MYRCPKCHVELPADARFCKSCGFNQTNARIAAMSSPMQGVQRQVPPQTRQGVQQSSTRTIQPQHKYVPQQSVTYQQAASRPETNGQVPQQNFPGKTSLPLQQAPQSTPRPQQGEVLPQRNNGSQQLTRQYIPETPPFPNPQQGSVGSNGFQQQPPSYSTGPAAPQGFSSWGQQSPATPQGQFWGQSNQQIPELAVRTSTPPIKSYATANASFEPLQWGITALPDTPVSVESLEATSKAAQHWRQSWIDRQRAEAGPAVSVSRGQASVPEPLSAMQNSFARMRAIILPKNGVDGKDSRLRFWLPVILLVCLIGGLGTYVLSTYPGGLFGSSLASANPYAEPTLTLKNAKTTTFVAGQVVRVHGEHFGPNDTIRFYLDKTQLKAAGGKPAIAQSNDRGTFDASLSIPRTQLAGDFTVQAQDNSTGQHAFLTIETTASTTTDILKLSVPALTFASITGHDNPQGQSVSITNTSNATIQWSATAISDNQAGWLLLANGKTSGQLDAGKTDTIRVNAFTQGLPTSPAGHPYTGEIVFTVADQGQVTLPVQLTLSETGMELIINPNPLFALQSPTIPGGCQVNTSLTLINLSNIPVNFDVQTDGFSQQRITLDGKPEERGQLSASGTPNDTQVIKIGCNGVQLDKQYAVNVFYNGSQQQVPISVTKG